MLPLTETRVTSLPDTRLPRIVATLVLLGALTACAGSGPQATTGTIIGAGVARPAQARDEVVCAFDQVYGRDVCYRD